MRPVLPALTVLLGLATVGAAMAQDDAAQPPKHPSAALAAQMARADAEARAKRAPVSAAASKLSVTCTLCYTCGTTWPIFAGTFQTTQATERTASCASGPTTLSDTSPYLCCRRLPN
jgi:hypothetical protein